MYRTHDRYLFLSESESEEEEEEEEETLWMESVLGYEDLSLAANQINKNIKSRKVTFGFFIVSMQYSALLSESAGIQYEMFN